MCTHYWLIEYEPIVNQKTGKQTTKYRGKCKKCKAVGIFEGSYRKLCKLASIPLD